MRTRTAVVLFTCWLAATDLSTVTASQPLDIPASSALCFFQAFRATDPAQWLRALRPAPITPDQRARALAVLPEAGELTPGRDEHAKLALLKPILMYHERVPLFEIKLIDVPQAVVALYQRAAILISRPALRLVSGAELQALVAHEIGHEYFWADFERTVEQRDKLGRQELELKCDGIAVLTLIGVGGNPARLIAGLRKMLRFNEAIGAVANADEYPGLQDRERFVNAIRALALPPGPVALAMADVRRAIECFP
jgi:hypothetical protein